jgi:hypothetical protein
MKNKKNLNEELNRISSLMGLNLLNEQPDPRKTLLKFFIKNIDGQKVSSTVDDIIPYIDNVDNVGNISGKIDNLTDDQIKNILKNLNYEKYAEYLLKNNIFISEKLKTDTFNAWYERMVQNPENYNKLTEVFRDGYKTGWGTIGEDGLTPEMGVLLEKYADEFVTEFNGWLKTKDPDLYKKLIVNTGTELPKRESTKLIKTYLLRDVKSMFRIAVGGLKRREKLQKQLFKHIEDLTNKRLDNPSANVESEVQKILDNLSTQAKDYATDRKKMFEDFLSKQPRNVRNTIKEDEFYNILMQRINENASTEEGFWKALKNWAGLFKWKSDPTGSLRRIANLIVRQTPTLVSETATNLQKKGFYPTLANHIAGVLTWNYILLPLFVAFAKLSKTVLIEWGQSINNPDFVSVSEQPGGWWQVIVDFWRESVFTTQSGGFDIPGTYIDNIIALGYITIKPESIGLPTELSEYDGYIFISLPTNEDERKKLIANNPKAEELLKAAAGEVYYYWGEPQYKVEKQGDEWKLWYPDTKSWESLPNPETLND